MRSNIELVEFIREKAKDQNSSLTKMEELFGWSNGTIGKWKNAKKYPGHDKLKTIADFFKITVSELTGEKKEKPATQKDDELIPYAEYREVLQESGIRVLLDADAKVSESDLEDIVEFIKFKQRKNGR